MKVNFNRVLVVVYSTGQVNILFSTDFLYEKMYLLFSRVSSVVDRHVRKKHVSVFFTARNGPIDLCSNKRLPAQETTYPVNVHSSYDSSCKKICILVAEIIAYSIAVRGTDKKDA